MLASGWLMSHRRKDYCTQTTKTQKAEQREIRTRMTEVVYSHQFYLMAEKETCSLTLNSKVNPAIKYICSFSAHNTSFLILCNEAGEHLRG